jgi:hypothetical protein
VKIAIAGAKAAGAEVTYLDFRDLPLPLYDGDLEESEGLPDNARRLKLTRSEEVELDRNYSLIPPIPHPKRGVLPLDRYSVGLCPSEAV